MTDTTNALLALACEIESRSFSEITDADLVRWSAQIRAASTPEQVVPVAEVQAAAFNCQYVHLLRPVATGTKLYDRLTTQRPADAADAKQPEGDAGRVG
jgi:hypothetical protein